MIMKYFILLLSSFSLLVSCSNSNTINTNRSLENNTSQTQLPQSKPDSISKKNSIVEPISEELLSQLTKLLNPDAVKLIQKHQKQWEEVQTEFDFANAYHEGEKLFESLEALIDKKFGDDAYEAMSNLEILDKSYLFRAACEAECSVFLMKYYHPNLLKLAQYTSGKSDDEFMYLKLMVEGDLGSHKPNWLNFFIRTWDYGGGSLLGDNSNYLFLKKSFYSLQKSNLFKNDLLLLRNRVILDMEHPIYMNTREQVVSEINRIIKLQVLFPAELKQLNRLKSRIEKNAEEPPLQFNCGDPEEDCNWGG